MSTFEIDQFDPPPSEDCVCSICRCVLDVPRTTPCQHVFCAVCIQTWLQRSATCPACRGAVRAADLGTASAVLLSALAVLRLRCSNRAHGCSRVLRLDEYRSHVGECFYNVVRCGWSHCSEVLRQDMKAAHELACPRRKQRCTRGCSLMVLVESDVPHVCMVALEQKISSELLLNIYKIY